MVQLLFSNNELNKIRRVSYLIQPLAQLIIFHLVELNIDNLYIIYHDHPNGMVLF